MRKRRNPEVFLVGTITFDADEEGGVAEDYFVAAGFADTFNDSDIPLDVLPLPATTMGKASLYFLSVDGLIQGYVRNSNEPLSWLDMEWMKRTWPDSAMVWIIPVAALADAVAGILTGIPEFVDAARVEALSQGADHA